MALTRHLVIFTRLPMLGAGKRRLAKTIGSVQALRVQKVLLGLTLRKLGNDRRWTTWLAVTPDRSRPWPRRFRRVPQGTGDLGCRMARVARGLPSGPVVIVGSDIPGLSSGHIQRAFRELGFRTATFGPAPDGGYWLVGLRRRPHFIDPFAGVAWSSASTLSDTLANLAGQDVSLLDTLEDVDDAASLARHKNWYMLRSEGPFFTVD